MGVERTIVMVIADRLWESDPLQWGVWECEASDQEPLTRLAGPFPTREAALESANILCDAIERLTGRAPRIKS